MELTLSDILERLASGDETSEIEAKRGGAIDTSVLESVCAMANEPGLGGGYIVLGVSEKEDGLFGVTYSVTGVRDPGKLQSDLATRCRNDLQPPVRPEIRVETHGEKTVLVVFIPESPPGDKPVYLKSAGLPGGAFRRVGGTDQHCTEDDLALLYQGRTGVPYDSTPVDGSSLEDIDAGAVREYRLRRAEVNKDAGELRFPDDELLHALNATTVHRGEKRLTVAGLMLFGKEMSLRRFAPMTRVDYILIEGQTWVRDPDKRFTSVELRGPLMTLIPRVVQQILADVPAAFSLAADDLQRREVPLVPRKVIREAVVNALMHRNYRVASPVQILRYTNRIEIRNVGYSLKPEERLGEPGSLPRNPSIAAVLHEAGLAETKGSGIRTMRELMHSANLTPPFFESDRQKDSFGLMLLVHHLVREEDVLWLKGFASHDLADDEARMLVVLRETGAITNAMYRELTGTDTLTASKSLLRLRDAGVLVAHGKGRRTYYRLNPQFVGDAPSGAGGVAGVKPEGLTAQSEGFGAKPEGLTSKPEGFGAKSEGFPTDRKTKTEATELPRLPDDLAEAAKGLGGKASKERIREVILRLCAWQPLRSVDLGRIMDRDPAHLRQDYLYPMVEEGLLEFVHSENRAHPQQAYRTKKKRIAK